MLVSRRKFLGASSGILLAKSLLGQSARAANFIAPELASFSKGLRRPKLDGSAQLNRFCFGSCNSHKKDQPLWRHIARARPGLFMWLGDTVYGDTEDMAVLRDKYLQQLMRPDYRQIVENIPIIGTWDDHDFGQNNGDLNERQDQAAHLLLLVQRRE